MVEWFEKRTETGRYFAKLVENLMDIIRCSYEKRQPDGALTGSNPLIRRTEPINETAAPPARPPTLEEKKDAIEMGAKKEEEGGEQSKDDNGDSFEDAPPFSQRRRESLVPFALEDKTVEDTANQYLWLKDPTIAAEVLQETKEESEKLIQNFATKCNRKSDFDQVGMDAFRKELIIIFRKCVKKSGKEANSRRLTKATLDNLVREMWVPHFISALLARSTNGIMFSIGVLLVLTCGLQSSYNWALIIYSRSWKDNTPTAEQYLDVLRYEYQSRRVSCYTENAFASVANGFQFLSSLIL